MLDDLVLVASIRKNRLGGSISGRGGGGGGEEGGEVGGGASRNGSVSSRSGKNGGEEGGSGSAGGGTLVAERCWVLTEVTVVDAKDSGGESSSACSNESGTRLSTLLVPSSTDLNPFSVLPPLTLPFLRSSPSCYF